MMEYGTGWLGREPAPWDRHRWRLNLRGDSEGGGGGGGSDDNRTFPAFNRTSGFDMPGIDSINSSRNSLSFRRGPFQNFDMPGGQGPGSTGDFGRLMPGFSGASGDNRDNFQRNFFGGTNKDDFPDRSPANRPFGPQRGDPVTSFDRDATLRNATAMMRFGQNFGGQDLNSRSDRAADGATGSSDRTAPFGRRMNNSPRFPQPGQFDVANNRQGSLSDTFNFSGLPVDPWLPSGTAATAPPDWRSGGTPGNPDFQNPPGAQVFSASLALQRMSSQQNRKRPWQQLLSVVGRRNSRDQELPDADLNLGGGGGGGGSGGGGVGGGGGSGGGGSGGGSGVADVSGNDGLAPGPVFSKARPGRKQPKPLKHEGNEQNHEDDLTPEPYTQNNNDTSVTVPENSIPSELVLQKSEVKPEKDMDAIDTPLSVKSESEDKEAEVDDTPIDTHWENSENPLMFEELRTLFPLTLMYGEAIKEEKKWPKSCVVLSTVEIQCADKSKVRFCYISRSEEGKEHPEITTMNKIRAITVNTDMTLKVTLVMNYTPCFYCACSILSYFFDIKSRQIKIAMELKFSNLYRVHMYPCDAPSELQTEIDRNIDGLQTLHLNGVGLQTFSGVGSWYENLLNTDFLDSECKEKIQEIVDIVESDERKEREERDEEDLCNILGL